MPCKNCKLKPVIQLTNSNIRLCKDCFIYYFEKKVLKTLRVHDMIGKSKTIYVLDDKFSEINFNILNNLAKERHEKFKVLKTKTKKMKIAVSNNLDKVSYLVLLSEFKNKFRKDLTPINKNIINPLYFMNNKEIELYAKIKNLKIKKEKLTDEEKKVISFVNDVEERYPGTINNLVNSYLNSIKACIL